MAELENQHATNGDFNKKQNHLLLEQCAYEMSA